MKGISNFTIFLVVLLILLVLALAVLGGSLFSLIENAIIKALAR